MLNFLYNTVFGRIMLKFLTRPIFSRVAGFFMDSKISSLYIKKFIKANNISLEDFLIEDWKSFNAFFTRKTLPKARDFSSKNEEFISPCDGLLTAYKITESLTFSVKNSIYSFSSLLKNEELAKDYLGGDCLVFRLTPSHYHRYHYFDSGKKGDNIFIKGVLHTVQPVAVENALVYTENCREYTVLNTDNFGDVVFMEVGAMLVGRIVNYHQSHSFCRGEEKGRFEFGGSTIILLFKEGCINLFDQIFETNKAGKEFPVSAGQKLGFSKIV